MRVCYGLDSGPVSHDFLYFMVRAERYRKEHGKQSLQVQIADGNRLSSSRDFCYTQERKRFRGQMMLQQLAWLMPSVNSVEYTFAKGRLDFDYSPIEEPILDVRLHSSAAAKSIVSLLLADKQKPVSITVRMSDFQEERNSNLEATKAAFMWLDDNGYTPIVVPDSDHYMATGKTPLPGSYYAAGAMNADIRLALYEQCLNNVMTIHGPTFMAMISHCNYLAFVKVNEEHPAARKAHMRRRCVDPDSFWGPGKQIFWADDQDTIIRAMKEYLPGSVPQVASVLEDRFTSNRCRYA